MGGTGTKLKGSVHNDMFTGAGQVNGTQLLGTVIHPPEYHLFS